MFKLLKKLFRKLFCKEETRVIMAEYHCMDPNAGLAYLISEAIKDGQLKGYQGLKNFIELHGTEYCTIKDIYPTPEIYDLAKLWKNRHYKCKNAELVKLIESHL